MVSKKETKLSNKANSALDKTFNFIDKSVPRNKISRNLGVVQTYSAGQMMIRELLGHGQRTWGTGQNLPKINRDLISGGGLIKNGDVEGETGSMFGIRRRRM